MALPEDAFFIPPGEHKISVAHGVEITAKTDKYAMARLIVWRREFGETLKNRLILESYSAQFFPNSSTLPTAPSSFAALNRRVANSRFLNVDVKGSKRRLKAAK